MDFVPVEGPQSDFLTSPARELFFGGLPGGMKSKSLVVDALGLYQENNLGFPACMHPMYHAVLFRREERQLAQLIKYAYEYFPALGGVPTAKGMQWEFPGAHSHAKGGKLNFSHMHHEEDYLLWQGHELCYVGYDEVTQFKDTMYGGILPWNRSPEGSGLDVFVRSTANPIGPGVPWVRDRFIKSCTPGVIHEFDLNIEGELVPWSRQFIPSSFRDNPYMRKEYPAAIAMMPNPGVREALLHPDPIMAWSIVLGSFFSQFNNVQHVIKRSEEKEALKSLQMRPVTRVEGLDYGFRAPFCTLWLMEDTEGDVYVVDEHYKTKLTIDKHAEWIHRKRERLGWERSGVRQVPFKTIADPSIWYEGNRKVLTTDKTIGQELSKRGVFTHRANNDILNGLRLVHEYMDTDGVVPPRLHIFESCENLIDEIVNATTDEKDIERIEEGCADHAIDSLRYALMYIRKARAEKVQQESVGQTFDSLLNDVEDSENPYYRR